MAVKVAAASLARRQAADRLNPQAREVFQRCVKREAGSEVPYIKYVYETAADLTFLRQNTDTYGPQGFDDTLLALGISLRTAQSHMAIYNRINPEEFGTLVGLENDEGRTFTVKHLMVISTLESKSDRARAVARWKKDGMTHAEFEDYVAGLKNPADDSDGEVDEAVEDAVIPTSRAFKSLAGGVEKTIDVIRSLDSVDVGAVAMTLTGKSAAVVDTVRVGLRELSGLIQPLLERLDAKPRVSEEILKGGLGGLEELAKSATADTQSTAKQSVRKPAGSPPPKDGVPKRVAPGSGKAAVAKATGKKAATSATKSAAKSAAKSADKSVKGVKSATKPAVAKPPKAPKNAVGFKPVPAAADPVKSTLAAASQAPASSKRRGKADATS